ARRPLHLAPTAHEIDVVLLEAVDAVAARFLRRCAGAIRGGQQRGDVLVLGRDRYDADTRAQTERPLFPHELVVTNRLAERLGVADRLFERAALEQHAELVTAQARDRVAPTDLRFEECTH